MKATLLTAWRRLFGLVRRRRDPAPVAAPPFLQVDEARRWRGPAHLTREPAWLDRPERDRLRRDLRSQGTDLT